MYIIIPARIGSKRIFRKNLRPFLGKPLIFWTIETALTVDDCIVVLTTDSRDIGNICKKKFGERILIDYRDDTLTSDEETLDQTVSGVLSRLSVADNELIVTIQSTSPALDRETIIEAIRQFKRGNWDTAVCVNENKKLEWEQIGAELIPKFEARVNSQYLNSVYTENGALVICKAYQIRLCNTRFGSKVLPVVGNSLLKFDIDTPEDWFLLEQLMSTPRTMYFVVVGDKLTGSGHVNRAITLAHEFPQFNLKFLGINLSQNFVEQISGFYLEFRNYGNATAVEKHLSKLKNAIIVFDILDTTHAMVKQLKSRNNIVVSFEDLGSGSLFTDLTINELYPPVVSNQNICSGPDFALFRNEFIQNFNREIEKDIELLILFGGTDPNALTLRTLQAIATQKALKIKIVVVLGVGSKHLLGEVNEVIARHSLNCEVISDTKTISSLMMRAKSAISSAGRTLFELACFGVPTTVLCQNTRELTHLYATQVNGYANLGLHSEVRDVEIINSIVINLNEKSLRVPKKINPAVSNQNVISQIRGVIHDWKP